MNNLTMESIKRYIKNNNIAGYINLAGRHITILEYNGLGKGRERALEYFIHELLYHIFNGDFKGFLDDKDNVKKGYFS